MVNEIKIYNVEEVTQMKVIDGKIELPQEWNGRNVIVILTEKTLREKREEQKK